MWGARLLFPLLMLAGLFPRPAAAAMIGLGAPLGGTLAPGDTLDLEVTFDANGSAAGNLVANELYIEFSGLVPIPVSYALGSLYTPFVNDLVEINGPCADLGWCNHPLADPASPAHYMSLVSVFAPGAPVGPGGLFTLRFLPAPAATSWSLNLLGDDAFGLFWDPPPGTCDASDPNCEADQPLATFPFAIVTPNGLVPSGTARVNVSVTQVSRPVPEALTLSMLLFGIATLLGRRRRLRVCRMSAVQAS